MSLVYFVNIIKLGLLNITVTSNCEYDVDAYSKTTCNCDYDVDIYSKRG